MDRELFTQLRAHLPRSDMEAAQAKIVEIIKQQSGPLPKTKGIRSRFGKLLSEARAGWPQIIALEDDDPNPVIVISIEDLARLIKGVAREPSLMDALIADGWDPDWRPVTPIRYEERPRSRETFAPRSSITIIDHDHDVEQGRDDGVDLTTINPRNQPQDQFDKT